MIKILVANRGEAELYDAEKVGAPVTLIRRFTNPEAHLHERELVSDAAGQVYNRMGGMRQSYGQRHVLRDRATLNFAQAVASSLLAEVHAADCAGLLLVGSPRFMNRLRDALPAQARAKVFGMIPKNLAHIAPDALKGYINQARRTGRLD